MRAEELQRLAAKAKRGDKNAYEQLFHETKNLIYGRTRKYVFDQNCLDDAVQEVCLSIIKSLGGYDETKPYLPWLVLLIKTTVINYNKKHGRQSPNGIISLDSSDFDYTRGNDDTFEMLERLNQSLAKLPKKQRQILVYHTLGFKQEEIADLMNIKVGTVKSQLHKARKQAKSEYERLGGLVAIALWKVYEAEAAEMPAALSAKILAQSANVAITAGATTSSIMATLATMTTGTKTAIISVISLVVIASVGIPLRNYSTTKCR